MVNKITFFFSKKWNATESGRGRPNEHAVEDWWEASLKNHWPICVFCFLKGEIKPLDQVFHFQVSSLILESPLTTLGQSGNRIPSIVIAAHLWGHRLQQILEQILEQKVLLQNTFSKSFPGSITLEVRHRGSYRCFSCKPSKEKVQVSWAGLLWVTEPCVPTCLEWAPFISIDLVWRLIVPSFKSLDDKLYRHPACHYFWCPLQTSYVLPPFWWLA